MEVYQGSVDKVECRCTFTVNRRMGWSKGGGFITRCNILSST